MRSPQQPFYALFGAAFLLAGCGPGGGSDTATTATASRDAVVPAGNKCQKFVKVSADNDPHFELEERFRISGPTQDGDYRLRPVGSGHQVLSKDHPLVKSTESGSDFQGEIEIQGPGHGQVSQHYYAIVADLDSDGCPSKLVLETMQHAGDPVIGVHGGDAVMD